MSNFITTVPGAVNGAGDAKALFYKLFTGEVLTAFESANVMEGRHRTRNITSGKSASFAHTGKVNAGYHTPGAELTGQTTKSNETVIAIDDLLVSDVFISNIEEAMNHFDVRAEYSTQMGNKLASTYDIAVQRELVKVARAANKITGLPGGTQLKNDKFRIGGTGSSADNKAKAVAIAEGLFMAAQTLAEKDQDAGQANAMFSPAEYFCLAQNTDLINSLWGGAGAYSDGKIFRVAGLNILMSNRVPHDDTSVSDTRHGVDASKTIGLVWLPDAVATVKLMELALESEYLIKNQGTLMVAKMAVGHGGLRPECAIELCLDTLAYA